MRRPKAIGRVAWKRKRKNSAQNICYSKLKSSSTTQIEMKIQNWHLLDAKNTKERDTTKRRKEIQQNENRFISEHSNEIKIKRTMVWLISIFLHVCEEWGHWSLVMSACGIKFLLYSHFDSQISHQIFAKWIIMKMWPMHEYLCVWKSKIYLSYSETSKNIFLTDMNVMVS